MRVRLAQEKCSGHALCNFHGPEVFTLDHLGFCSITVVEVTSALADQARKGANACPERAITIEEE